MTSCVPGDAPTDQEGDTVARHQLDRPARNDERALHIALTVLTCGLWAVTGWPARAAWRRRAVTSRNTERLGVL